MWNESFMSTVWSAAPTPFDRHGQLDLEAVNKLADHHDRLGIRGVFIGGTAGEGPLLPRRMLFELARATVAANAGRMATALQITDNSAERMIENIRYFTAAGVDLFVIAPPFMCLQPTQEYLFEMYRRVIEASPIPVGIYHRGKSAAVAIAPETIVRLAALPNVVTLKDSACTEEDTRAIIAARDMLRGRKPFFAYSGNEFDCVGAARAGYDGMMIGGACFNGRLAKAVFELARNGRLDEATALQERLNELMYDCFGGRSISCWLAGEKQILVELGIFQTPLCLMNYQLTPECAAAIRRAVVREAEWLR